MQLTAKEELELRYMQALGHRWIARDKEIGCYDSAVWAYKEKPTKQKNSWKSNDTLTDICGACVLGEYNFLKWEDEAMEIDKLLMENGWDVPLVEPPGTGI